MICRTCIKRATALGRRFILPQSTTTLRTFSSTIAPRQAAAAPAPAAATTTTDSAAVPLADATPDESQERSSCPPGTVLNGLNYFKGKTDPVAKADIEYPEWLWLCLDVQKGADAETDDVAGDEYCTC